MSIELIVASVAITCALVLYTFGVFGERRSGTLSLRHVLLFWGGLVCDTTGTMIKMCIRDRGERAHAGVFGQARDGGGVLLGSFADGGG